MEPFLTQITHYLFRQSWHIALLIAAVAAVSYLARNRSAHVRYLLWLIVLAKCLVPPLYTVPLAVLPERPVPEPVVTTPAEVPPLSLELIEAARPQPYMALALPSASAPTPEPVTPTRPTIAQQLSKVSLRQWLALGWLVGASLFVLVALIKAWRTNRWLRRDRRPLPVNLKAEVDRFFCDLGIKTRPKVWLITGVGQPFVWGMLRGSIYLPGKFEQVNGPAGWRGVLGHELSHVMRFDAAVNFLQVIAQAVYWFHPFVWWANKRLREEREKCCDEMAIARLNTRPKDYSTAIVNTLIAEHKAKQPVPSLAIAGPVKNIEDRIKTIMKSGKRFYRRPTFITIITILLLAAVAVPTTLALTSREEEPATEKAATDTETDWGEAVEGMQMRVRAERQTWYESETPKFLADMRNNGTVEWKLGLIQENWQVELDGVWYRVGTSFTGVFPTLLLGPGDEHKGIEFSPQEGWDWNINGEPLRFTPGWHTVRLAFEARTRDRAYSRRLRLVSNPVVVEVLAAEADKREWGEAVSGLQCGLRADKRFWETDETPRLQVVIRNVGERPWSLPRPSELLYLKAEGKIWRWKGPASGEPVELKPGQALQERTVLLTEGWSGLEDVRLELPPGRYPVQVVMLVREPTPPEYLRIESNVVVISVVSAREKPGTVADQADAATTLDVDLHEIWVRRDRDLAGAEAFGLKLLEKYTQSDEQALIHYQLALIYAQSGVSPSKTIEYARNAWWNLNDPVRKAQLFVFWGDALRLSKDRREAAKAYLRGLEFCLQFGLPEEKPERPAVSRYRANGPPEVVEEYRRKNRVQAAAWKHARFIEDLIQHRQALTGQIVQLYAQEPDAFDELRELVMKYLGSEQAAEQLIAAAKAYRKNHKLSIPVITRMGPDPDPEADLHWGQPTEGISVRLRAEATKWVVGQTLKFKIDVRNDGSHILMLTPEPECWQVEIDGVGYKCAISMLGGAKGMSFGPDKRWYNLELSLDAASGLLSENGGVELTQGRHIVRAVLAGARSADGIMVPIGAPSDPVEIEILPVEEGGDFNLVGAVKEGTARLRAAAGIKRGKGKTLEEPKKIEFMGLDLTDAPRTTDWVQLPDLFEERPPGSKSYEVPSDVKAVFSWLASAVYYVPAEDIFYVQHDDLGSSVFHYYGPFEGDPYNVLDLEVFYKDLLGYSDILKTRPAIFAAITSSNLVYEVADQGLPDAEKEDVLDETVKALKKRLAADGRLDEVKIEIRDGKVLVTVPNSGEGLAKLGVDRERYERFDSAEKLKRLGRALLVYANDHNGRYPRALGQLKGYVDDKDLRWALHRVGYLGKGKTGTAALDEPVAYDKALLRSSEGRFTNVLFNDGHVALRDPEQLHELGISVFVFPEEAVSTVNRFREALTVSDWNKALSYCSDRVKAAARGYESVEAFFRDIVPVEAVTGKPDIVRHPIKGDYNHLVGGLHFLPGSAGGDPEEELWWQFRVDKSGAGWIIDFETKSIRDRIEERKKDRLLTAALEKERQVLRKAFQWKLDAVKAKTRLTPVSREFVVGRPMLFRLELVNEGKVELFYDRQQVAVNSSMTITDEKGERVSYTFGPEQTAGRYQKIKAGSSAILFDNLDISSQYDLNKAGKYKVRFNGRGLGIVISTAPDQNEPADNLTGTEMKLPPNRLRATKLPPGTLIGTNLNLPSNIVEIEVGALKRHVSEKAVATRARTAELVRKQLSRIVDLSQWNPEMPFADALEQLKNSVEPPLSIVVLWRDLEENAAIDRTTPINMEGVSGIYLGTALRLLLRSVSAGAEIDFVIKDGVIVIATKEALPNTLETRVYDIYGFTAPPVGVDAG